MALPTSNSARCRGADKGAIKARGAMDIARVYPPPATSSMGTLYIAVLILPRDHLLSLVPGQKE